MVTAKEYARLCSVVYRDGDIPPEGWEILKGRNGSYEHTKTGFYAEAWKNQSGDLVIAVRGTANKQGVYNDIQLGVGIVPDQYEHLKEYYDSVVEKNNDLNISITGHSLGGGLVQILSADLKHNNQKQIYAETFEAPGMMHVAVLKWGPQHIPKFMTCDVVNHMRVTDIVPWIGSQLGTNKYCGPEFNIEHSKNLFKEVINIVKAQHSIEKLADYYWKKDDQIAAILSKENNTDSPMEVEHSKIQQVNLRDFSAMLRHHMGEIDKEQIRLAKIEPLNKPLRTKEQVQSQAASEFLKGEDRRLEQKERTLKKEIRNYNKELDRHNEQPKPKLYELKQQGIYHFAAKQLTEWRDQIIDRGKEITKQKAELKKQQETSDAKAYIEKRIPEIIKQDTIRQTQLEVIKEKQQMLQQEHSQFSKMNILAHSIKDRNQTITIQGNVKDMKNILRQSQQLQKQITNIKEQAKNLSKKRSLGRG